MKLKILPFSRSAGVLACEFPGRLARKNDRANY